VDEERKIRKIKRWEKRRKNKTRGIRTTL